METAIIAALVGGGFGLAGVALVVFFNQRNSKREISSSEGIALRSLYAKQDSDLRSDMANLNAKLLRCENERAADAAQRIADQERHQADEDQRRIDDERHRADEARHVFDTAEILSTRQQLASVRGDLDKLRHQLHDWANIPDSGAESGMLAGSEPEP